MTATEAPDVTPEELLGTLPPIDPIETPSADERPRKSKPTTRAGRREAAEAAKARRGDKAPKTKATPKPNTRTLAGRIAGFYNVMGIGVGIGLGPEDGMAITANAVACGEAWAKAAQQNPGIADAWEKILGASVMGEIVMAHAPIIIGIAANHGMIPPGVAAMMGGVQNSSPMTPEPSPYADTPNRWPTDNVSGLRHDAPTPDAPTPTGWPGAV